MRLLPLFVCCLLTCAWSSPNILADDPPSKKPSSPPAKKEAATDSSKSATHKVAEEPFKIRVEQQGIFESSRMKEVAITPKSTIALTVERAVGHGRQVKKGQTIIWLDTTKIDEQIRSAEHNLTISRLSLRESEADLEMAEKSLPLDMKAAALSKKRAFEDLDYFTEVTRASSMRSARYSLDSSKHSLEYAQEELDQLRKMYEADDLTEESEELILKRAQRSVESAKYFLESAQQRHDRTIEQDLPRQTEDMSESVERQELSFKKSNVTLPISLEKRQLETEKTRQQIKKSADDLAKLKMDRQKLNVTAPMDGVVYYGRCTRGKWGDPARMQDKLSPGGTLLPKQPLLTIVALRPLIVRVNLAEKDLPQVRRGMLATLQPVAMPEVEITAKVTTISQIPIAPGIFDCQLRLEDKQVNASLVPGMNCKVMFRVYDNETAIAVPKTAVFNEKEDTKKNFVYVLNADGKPEKRSVVVGKRSGDKAEIRKGLKAGEEILMKKPEDPQK